MLENKKRKKLNDSLKLSIDNISDAVIGMDDKYKTAGVNRTMTHRSDCSVDRTGKGTTITIPLPITQKVKMEVKKFE
jgi:hypothetical protein